MQKKIVLTKIDNFFRENYENIYLSRACFSYELEKKFPKEVLKIPIHHWNDYNKLKKDKDYFNNLFDRIFPSVADMLNSANKTNHTKKFWEILIKSWLHSFCYICFDHWEMAKKIELDDNNYLIDTFKIDETEMISKTIEDFIRLFSLDTWRHLMFLKIFKSKYFVSGKKIIFNEKNNFENKIKKNRLAIQKYQKNYLKNFIIYFYNMIFGPFIRKQKFFIARTYIGKWNEFLINFKLKQFPTIFIPNIYNTLAKPDLKFRKNLILNFNPKSDFEHFLKQEITMQIPVSFLEGFNEIEAEINKLYLPESPKSIFLSNSHNKSILTRYLAKKSENGTKIIHGQHGGSYGQWDMHWLEKYEKSISDLYLTWGWKDHSNTYPFGILRPIGAIRKNHKKNFKDLLMIIKIVKSYSYALDSNSGACQSKNYLNECFSGIDNLRKDIRENLLIRFRPLDKGWNEFSRFSESFPKLKKDVGTKSVFSVMKNTKIYFATYNSTGYLESLAMNIPTVLFSNPYDEKLRSNSEYYFNLLKNSKIYFESSIEATKHINNIWDNVDDWWLSQDVQFARKEFCSNYARLNKNKLNEILSILKKAS